MPHTHQKEETRAGKPEVSPSMAIDVKVFSWEVSIRVQDFQGPLGKKWHHHNTVIVSILITVAVCIKETTLKVQMKVASATCNTNFALLRLSYVHPEEEETKNTMGTKWQEWVSKGKQYQIFQKKRQSERRRVDTALCFKQFHSNLQSTPSLLYPEHKCLHLCNSWERRLSPLFKSLKNS